MPKIQTVKHAQRRTNPDGSPKPNRVCEVDAVEIMPGQPYKWVTTGFRSNVRRIRCATCPDWHPWEISNTLQARAAQITHEARQAIEDVDDPEDVQQALDDAVAAIRELAEERRESAQNMEDGFGHSTSRSEELAEAADGLDSWAEEVEGIEVPELPDPEETDCEACDESNRPQCKTCGGEGAYTPDEPTEEQLDEWRGEVQAAIEALDNAPA